MKLFISPPVGPAGAPLLVLGNSLGTSTILWEDLRLPQYRVAQFDLPGHGRSPAATGSFTVADIASALGEQVGEFFLYGGVSLGGAVGLELLLQGHVTAAAIICSGAKIGTADGWAERAAHVRAQGTASLVVPSAQRWFAPGSIERHPDITGRLLHALRDTDDESYALCAEALAQYDTRSRLGEITAPVLAVWGEFDAVTPEGTAVEIAEGVIHGFVRMVADAAHLAPAEQPAVVAALMTDFFERQG